MNGMRLNQHPQTPDLIIAAEDGRVLLRVDLSDGTVEGAVEDMSEAGRIFIAHVRSMFGASIAPYLSTPPADDVREALIEVLADEQKWVYNGTHTVFNEGYGADAIVAAFEVRPRGTVTDTERLEYTVAAISDNGAITSLSGESTVVRDHLEGDLELYRQQQVEAGCDPERIIIAQRPIPKWERS